MKTLISALLLVTLSACNLEQLANNEEQSSAKVAKGEEIDVYEIPKEVTLPSGRVVQMECFDIPKNLMVPAKSTSKFKYQAILCNPKFDQTEPNSAMGDDELEEYFETELDRLGTFTNENGVPGRKYYNLSSTRGMYIETYKKPIFGLWIFFEDSVNLNKKLTIQTESPKSQDQ